MSELDTLISGKSDLKRAKAVTKIAAQVIYKDRLEIEKQVIDTKTRMWFGTTTPRKVIKRLKRK